MSRLIPSLWNSYCEFSSVFTRSYLQKYSSFEKSRRRKQP